MTESNFTFPSGLTSNRAKQIAKTQKKLNQTSNSIELDKISMDQCGLPWHKAAVKFTKLTNDLRSQVAQILKENPLLGFGGFYSPLHFADFYYQKRFSKTRDEYAKFFEEGRTITDDWLKQIEIAAEFMSHFEKTKNINSRMMGSYGLKHLCERYVNRAFGKHHYISNGALIVGAILNGFNYKQPEEFYINCEFNVSKMSDIYQWLNMYESGGLRNSQRLKLEELGKKFIKVN